jgi:hypothetical protein
MAKQEQARVEPEKQDKAQLEAARIEKARQDAAEAEQRLQYPHSKEEAKARERKARDEEAAAAARAAQELDDQFQQAELRRRLAETKRQEQEKAEANRKAAEEERQRVDSLARQMKMQQDFERANAEKEAERKKLESDAAVKARLSFQSTPSSEISFGLFNWNNASATAATSTAGPVKSPDVALFRKEGSLDSQSLNRNASSQPQHQPDRSASLTAAEPVVR